ncbi:hypothetical protein AB1L42_09630 [Thalassoglobus sp. JC818]|uniref:hypothetical protein n=1 Tax=Thalassoglobus sp. JC818 TaxID=3232136 RepID=UPI0034584903
MVTPVEFMKQYRNLSVPYVQDTGTTCRDAKAKIEIRKYFMMDWDEGTEERTDYNHVTSGGRRDTWFQDNKQKIRNAAMGKGSPDDYQLALEWAIRSSKIRNPTQATIQTYCDQRLGIDCSGFVTNYLIANGKKPDSPTVKRNTGAASYYSTAKAVNDPNAIRPGHLLVWMSGNSVKRSPGHVAVIQSYRNQCVVGGNMSVVESTGAGGANPKLLDSMYTVEEIIEKGGRVPVMILVVKRHGKSGSRVAVMNP